MRKLLTLFFLFNMCFNVFAQENDSLSFVKQFSQFVNNQPLELAQLSKYDNLNNLLDTNDIEKLKKTFELVSLINKIDKIGIGSLKQDTSELLTYSPKKQKYFLYIDENVNFEKVQELTGLKIEAEFKNFSKIISEKNGIEIYSYKILRKDSGGGIQLPPFIDPLTSPNDSFNELANEYWASILGLLNLYSCTPSNTKILAYYKAQEKPGDSWRSIADKRRRFIDFIKTKCILK